MKNVYFLSDAHLGSRAIEHGRTQERRLVNFLDSIKHKASAVYLLGLLMKLVHFLLHWNQISFHLFGVLRTSPCFVLLGQNFN